MMKTEENYLELRAIMYKREDDEVTLQQYGNSSFEVTSGDISYTTLHILEKSGFFFFVSEGHLVIMK